jgi:hypothetical protein
MPGDPKLILPGLAFAWAMNSGTVLAGTDGLTTMTKGRLMIIEFVVEGRIDRVRRTYDQERIAVWRRPHDRLGANIVAATGAVFHDELLAEPLREPRPDEPRDNIGRAAREPWGR